MNVKEPTTQDGKMRTKLLTIVFVLSLIVPSLVFAQSKEDVIKSFNSAFALAQAEKHMEAFNGFEATIAMAEKVGADVADIKTKAETQLAPLMFKYAGSLYKSKKVDEALAGFARAKEVAVKYNDNSIAQKSDGVLMKVYNNLGTNEFKKGNFDAAIENYNKALAINGNYDAAIFNIAEALNKLEKRDESIAMLDKARQVGERLKSPSITRKAERKAAEYLIYWGATAIEQQKYSAADEYLNKALIYDIESSDAYYRLAELSNKQGQYSQAVDFAEQALDFEKGPKVEKAKIYFELGLAQQSMGNKDKACSAFKSASFGRFKASAEHKIEHELKCDGAK
jgi:tetratricopeptide (TPR) repeat protein